MKHFNFTIITISYNQAKFLSETIRSVISQKYPKIQYIVIDGGSNDNSIDILNKFDKHIDYWISEPDKGPADALNKGLEKATGDFIYYLNSDDCLSEGALKRINLYLNKYPDYDFYYGHGFLLKEKKIKRIYSGKWSLKNFQKYPLPIIQQSHFIRNSKKLKEIGFNNNNKTCWDLELMIDLTLIGYKFKRYNFHTGIFRIHNQSITGGSDNKDEHARNIERLKKVCSKDKYYKRQSNFIYFFVDFHINFKRLLNY